MIPVNSAMPGAVDLTQAAQQPSRTYFWDIEADRIRGYTDEQIAMKQSNYHILMTERYKHEIYTPYYGIELADLFGQPIPYCIPEIKRRVTEALLHDDRNLSVGPFEFDTSTREVVKTKFWVHTIFGDDEMNLEVPI